MAVIYNNKVNNDQGAPALFESALASFPTTHVTGRLLVATDTFALYRDNGTGYDLIGGPGTGTVTGSGTSGQVVYWNSASTVTGNNAFFWDAVNQRLGINTTTPRAQIDINGTSATLVILNNTGTTDSLVTYQNQGVNKWSVGNSYNGGTNDYIITDVTAAIDVMRIAHAAATVTYNYDLRLTGNGILGFGGINQYMQGNTISNKLTIGAGGGGVVTVYPYNSGQLVRFATSNATTGYTEFFDANANLSRGYVGYGGGILSGATVSDFIVRGETNVKIATNGNTLALNINSSQAATFQGTLGINGVADNVKSGTYTPTVTGTANVSANTPLKCQYIRVGNVVTVSGSVLITPTAANTTTTFTMSLPITSNFSGIQSCGGAGNWTAGTTPANYTTAISAQTGTPGTAFFSFYSDILLGSRFIPFSFTYLIE